MKLKFISIGLFVLSFGALFGLFSFLLFSQIETITPDRKGSSKEIEISINTTNNEVLINSIAITQLFMMSEIEAVLGKPSRVESQTKEINMEEFSYDGKPPHAFKRKVTNRYFIYDELGLMFYSNNVKSTIGPITKLLIRYKNKRIFDNTGTHPYNPRNVFKGQFFINNNAVSDSSRITPLNVDYNTEEFKLFNTDFGPTSIGGKVDRLYSIGASPYLLIYLNSIEEQKLSYIEVN